MTSKERVEATLNHQEPDRVPVDLGGTGQSGIHASILYRLRQELGLTEKPVEICEPYQMLGTVDEGLRKQLGVDVVPLWAPVTLMGTRFGSWTDWTMDDGTPVKMPGNFQYSVDKDGATLVYPQGDRTVKPSLKMPRPCLRRSGFSIDELKTLENLGHAFVEKPFIPLSILKPECSQPLSTSFIVSSALGSTIPTTIVH